MDNGLNNKVAIYWIVGIILVIALFLGFKYWGNKSEIVNTNLENNATVTESIDFNNEDGVIRPTNVSTTTPTKVQNQIPGFDYKG